MNEVHPDIAAALEVARDGALRGNTPGRSDVLEISVPSESFIVPSDVVSAIGQGNTEAGLAVLEKHWPPIAQHRADGGAAHGKTPIVAAAGEFIVNPDHIKRIGGGDLKRGHKALDDFVRMVRKKNIKKLKSMPGPHK